MYRYKYHVEADYGLEYEGLTKENTTWLSFEKWLTFYNADSENWVIHNHREYYNENYYLPAYKKEARETIRSLGKETIRYSHQYIKFLTRKDYRKFKRFVRKMVREGSDVENTKEILALAELIGSRATLRLEAAQEEVNKRYNLMLEQQTKATQSLISDNISELKIPTGQTPVCVPSFDKSGNPCHEIIAFKPKEEEPKFIINVGEEENWYRDYLKEKENRYSNPTSLGNPTTYQNPNDYIMPCPEYNCVVLHTWQDLSKFEEKDIPVGTIIYNEKEDCSYLVKEDNHLVEIKG